MSVLHLFKCSKRPLTSADYLFHSMGGDFMPEDEAALEDFGFNSLSSNGDKSYLLGVYRGLYLLEDFSSWDLHQWRIGGVLIDKIKEVYYKIPEDSRGGYFPWFLKNLYVLERPTTKDEATENFIATFFDKARPYLDIEDRNKTARDLMPEAKRNSYILLAQMLSQSTPNPMEINWYSFGFVTCREQQEEGTLLSLYQLLLTESDGSSFYTFHNSRRDITEPVTFTQFWKAYEAGELIQLMDSRGLKDLRSNIPFLERFLSVPPAGPRPTVWDLKQFLEINDPMAHPPIPSIKNDYGFVNCRTLEDTCILMEVYRKVLETANPLALHQACLAGNLFQFAKTYVQMEEQWRSLLRNSYP